MQRGAVGVTVHGDGSNPEIPARPEYTDRNFTPVRDEDFLDLRQGAGLLVYLFTACCVAGCYLLLAACWLLCCRLLCCRLPIADARPVDHFVKRSRTRQEHALYVWKTESAIAPERNVLLQFWYGDDALLLGSLFEL